MAMLAYLLHVLALLLSAKASSIPESHSPSFFYQGHDLSSLQILEETGSIYKDTARQNETRPAEAVLGDGGMNTVRLRIWVNPQDFQDQPPDYNLNYTLALASRFYKEGYRIYLDFHFSDTWADPNKQYPPAQWPTELQPLASTLRSYVSSTLQSFHEAGVQLSIVSLGNEIRNGMLWPVGQVNWKVTPESALIQNFTNLATLWKAAREGVSDAAAAGVEKPDVMIHIDDGWDVDLQTTWFGALTGTGLVDTSDWDVFGFSFYPFYGSSATFANLSNSLDTLADKYGKPMMVVETDWPVLCDGKYEPIPDFSEPQIPISVEGQLEWTRNTTQIIKRVKKGLGVGIFYWEPAWLNNTGLGSACEDAILFSQDFSNPNQTIGYSRESVDMFR